MYTDTVNFFLDENVTKKSLNKYLIDINALELTDKINIETHKGIYFHAELAEKISDYLNIDIIDEWVI